MKVINNKIKLVVWDLDDTFWKGTLSESSIEAIEENLSIVKELTDRGIINSICSKNDFEVVKNQLEQLQIWDLFVFPQISWDPKGKVISDLLEMLNLRADNVLFIDDNVLNLNEALFFLPNLNVCLPEHINTLLDNELLKGKDDKGHTRLAQYKNLEQKQKDFSKSKLSNVEFLKTSNIHVKIETDCSNHIDRIYELIERTNQLNYTKNRVSLDEFKSQIADEQSSSGYIKVTDRYGDYGISGFYMVKNNELIHFLFSCRTMNMFIESWVYRQIGAPKLTVVGDVAIQLDLTQDLSFINNTSLNNENNVISKIKGNKDILMLGGCDLDQIVFYMNYDHLLTEFNYVNKLNLNVHKDHTVLLRQFKNLQASQIEVIKNIPVLDVNDIDIKINSSNWDILIFSPLNDYSRGLYKHKASGFVLPFDNFNIDWTNENNWNNLPRHLQTLPVSFLEYLKNEFEFLGPISAEQFSDNIKWLIETYKDKKFIFLNGSEVVYTKGHIWEKDMHKRHIELNKVLQKFEVFDNVKVVDVRKFIKSENDITDNIRHYTKLAYKEISDEIVLVANEWVGKALKKKSKFEIFYLNALKKVKYKLNA